MTAAAPRRLLFRIVFTMLAIIVALALVGCAGGAAGPDPVARQLGSGAP